MMSLLHSTTQRRLRPSGPPLRGAADPQHPVEVLEQPLGDRVEHVNFYNDRFHLT